MTMTVDARGLACPQPVIQTRKAMEQSAQVVTLVDNDTAVANVSRMATKAGWLVQVHDEGGIFRIEMEQGEAEPQAVSQAVGQAEPAAGPLVLAVSSDVMGRGDDVLGDILIRGFFHTLGEIAPLPQTLTFFNTGARLACEGSPVLEDLCALEEAGVEILVCGTCLGHLEIKDQLAVGRVSNMYDIAETMLGAGKVVHL